MSLIHQKLYKGANLAAIEMKTYFETLVDKLIDYKIKNEQLTESQLSFEELNKCRTVFKQLLKSMLHVRIEYPEEENIE